VVLVLEERGGRGKEHCQVTGRSLPLPSLNIKLLVLEERASGTRRKRGKGEGTPPGDSYVTPSLFLEHKAFSFRRESIRRKRWKAKENCQVIARPLPLSSLKRKL